MVHFKSLYWTANEVKDAASEGLQTALSHQARLPKDLLRWVNANPHKPH